MNRQINKVKSHLDDRKGMRRIWWFTSFIFPLICATFAPLASLFSVLAFVESWVVVPFRAFRPADPAWLLALNSAALGTAIIGNILLLLGFARRIRYTVTQPLTIILWYISSALLIVALSMTRTNDHGILSQSYYYALLSSIMHLGMATLLLLSLLPSFNLPVFGNTFPAYPASILTLTAPQRTLMLQTLFFTLYLALGAGIFASLNGWAYPDAIYWTDYSLLTIGFGSDFTPMNSASRGLLIPYVAVGIFMLGLVVGSIRTLFIERFRERVLWGNEIVQKERDKWWSGKGKRRKPNVLWRIFMCCRKGNKGDGVQEGKCRPPMRWSKEEWDLMRMLKYRVDRRRRYLSLLATSTLFFVIWFGGAIIFAFTERGQEGFTYGLSLYFTYVSLFTIGYGDVIPRSNAGKPVFVLWSLAAIPAVTLLISDIQDTLARWVTEGPVESVFGRWLIGTVEDDEPCVHEQGGEEKAIGSHNEYGIEKENEFSETVAVKEVAHKACAILREIRKLLNDEENTQYSWEEWQKWLKLLELDGGSECEEGDVSSWTLLGDDGPLLSMRESEKIWILNRSRRKLDELFATLLG